MRHAFLITDFGTSDTYVAQMKAVILGVAPPGTTVTDLTHAVPRGSVASGAFHLRACWDHLPGGSVVTAVVDPGVGTARRAVVCLSAGRMLVAPDNGLAGLLDVERAWELPPPGEGASTTFHGRDVFAPAGARLLADPGWTSSLRELPPEDLVALSAPRPVPRGAGLLVTVAHVDRFGNVLLWLRSSDLGRMAPRSVTVGERRFDLRLVETYSDHGGLLLLKGSQGLMELAVSGGSAAELTGAGPGGELLLEADDG